MYPIAPYILKPHRTLWATAENPRALPGRGGATGGGRKGRPCLASWPAGARAVLFDQAGPGVVRRLWCTLLPGAHHHLRNVILRMWWDGQAHPSVEVPLGDFFGLPHGRAVSFASELVSAQSGRGLNCWIPMPFATHARIEVENDTGEELPFFFYEVDATVGDEVTDACGRFHALFSRLNPCPMHQDFPILPTIRGRGVFLGAVLGVRDRLKVGWFGEGEVKIHLDDDADLPSLVGTGLEDWVGSAWGLEACHDRWQGAPLVDKVNGYYTLYRWHVPDPVYFQSSIRVSVQQIGYGNRGEFVAALGSRAVFHPAAGPQSSLERTYVEREDDWSAVAYWYQVGPSTPLPPLPDRAARSADLIHAATAGRTDL